MSAPVYYQSVVECSATCPYVKNCNVDHTLAPRFIPRGSATRCQPGNALLMLILANPGMPQDIEDAHYRGKSGEDLANIAWDFTEAVCERLYSPSSPRLGAARSATHDNLMKHLAFDVFKCQINQVLDNTVVTNIVRCNTFNPNVSKDHFNFSNIDEEMQDQISAECVKRHLVGEIDYWKPKKIAVLGKPARRIIRYLRSIGAIDIKIDFETHHPSAVGNNIKERKEDFIKFGTTIRTEFSRTSIYCVTKHR